MDIIIDTKGQANLATKDRLIESDEDDIDFEDIGLDPLNVQLNDKKSTKKSKLSSTNDIDLDAFERDMGWKGYNKKRAKRALNINNIAKAVVPIDKVLEKTVIKPGFEQLESVPRYDESERRLREQRRREREKTKGKQWFNLPAKEMTEEIKRDLQVIQMRSALDPKRFYKKNDLKVLPKYFQIGKVIDTPLNYYNGRLTNKERKRTIVDELMADAEFSKYNKRKYKEIIEENKKLHYKAHKRAKKLKGKRR